MFTFIGLHICQNSDGLQNFVTNVFLEQDCGNLYLLMIK